MSISKIRSLAIFLMAFGATFNAKAAADPTTYLIGCFDGGGAGTIPDEIGGHNGAFPVTLPKEATGSCLTILGTSMGVSNSYSHATNNSAGKASVQNMNFSTYVGIASPALFVASAASYKIDTFRLIQFQGSKLLEVIELKNVVITSLEATGQDGNRFTQTFTLDFDRISYQVNPSGTNVKATGWDLKTNTKI